MTIYTIGLAKPDLQGAALCLARCHKCGRAGHGVESVSPPGASLSGRAVSEGMFVAGQVPSGGRAGCGESASRSR